MGESLPTAMEAMSMATGKSTAEVIQLVSTGKLMTKDVLIPFTNALRVLARRNGALAAGQHKLIANQARMNNAFKELIDKIFQGNGAGGISRVFKVVGEVITAVTPVIVQFTDALFSGISVVGGFVLAFGKLIGTTDNSANKVGILTRSWYFLVAVFYAAVEAVAALNMGMEKLNELEIPGWMKAIPFGPAAVAFSAFASTVSGTTPATTVNKNVTIGDMHFTTSSTDPKQSAIEMTSMISNLITAGR